MTGFMCEVKRNGFSSVPCLLVTSYYSITKSNTLLQ